LQDYYEITPAADPPPARVPPHSIHAEVSVIGSMLISSHVIGDVSSMLKPSDFYRPAHQEIFAALLDMALRGIAVDLVTAREELVYRGRLEALGGIEYLVCIVEGVPTADNVQYYADIVRRHARSRDLIILGDKLAGSAWDPGEDPKELIGQAQTELHALSLACQQEKEDMPLSAAMHQAMTQAQEIQADPTGKRLMTGFVDLDDFCGGFRPGEVVTLGGRQSQGKSTFAMNVIANVCQAGKCGIVVSGEMPAAQVAKRFIQSLGQIWGGRFRHGQLSDHEWDLADDAVEGASGWKLQIIGKPMSIPQIGIRAQRQAAHWGRDLDLLVIDYLQIMKPHEGRTIREQIMAISRDTKQMAMDLNCVILLLSQFSRPGRDAKGKPFDIPPSVYDLRESGTIEQDADFVLLLHRPEQQPLHTGCDSYQEVWLKVGKGRDTGESSWFHADPNTGQSDGIRLRWYPSFTLFTDWMTTVAQIPRLQPKPRPPVWERSKFGTIQEPFGNFAGRMWERIAEE